LAADFSGNGIVDAADYVAWRKFLPSLDLGAGGGAGESSTAAAAPMPASDLSNTSKPATATALSAVVLAATDHDTSAVTLAPAETSNSAVRSVAPAVSAITPSSPTSALSYLGLSRRASVLRPHNAWQGIDRDQLLSDLLRQNERNVDDDDAVLNADLRDRAFASLDSTTGETLDLVVPLRGLIAGFEMDDYSNGAYS
jgi:hypothetical protein